MQQAVKFMVWLCQGRIGQWKYDHACMQKMYSASKAHLEYKGKVREAGVAPFCSIFFKNLNFVEKLKNVP